LQKTTGETNHALSCVSEVIYCFLSRIFLTGPSCDKILTML